MGIYNEGDIVGRWRIGRPITQGAMGAIYYALDVRSGREVAFKVMLEQWLGRNDLMERFDREARALQALSLIHI